MNIPVNQSQASQTNFTRRQFRSSSNRRVSSSRIQACPDTQAQENSTRHSTLDGKRPLETDRLRKLKGPRPTYERLSRRVINPNRFKPRELTESIRHLFRPATPTTVSGVARVQSRTHWQCRYGEHYRRGNSKPTNRLFTPVLEHSKMVISGFQLPHRFSACDCPTWFDFRSLRDASPVFCP